MEPKEKLREIVAKLAGLEPRSIDASFSLKSRGLQSSVRRAALAAAIRRHLGVKVPDVYSVVSFHELEAAVFADESQQLTTAVQSTTAFAPSRMNELACGIDIERVDAMPVADDYWEHEFYKESFTKDEIAYCLLQENPRMHFAARWCAKEALVKCDPSFKGQPFSTIEVVRDKSGKVTLTYITNGDSTKPSHALSISHTETIAAAVVVRRQQ